MRPPPVLTWSTTIFLACTCAEDTSPDLGLEEWELVEDLRLDANVEDFSAVWFFYVGPRGDIVVPERQDYRVRIYDSAGTPVATVGRSGEGPGEFQRVTAGLWAADTLVVYDLPLSRLTYFLLDGTLVRTVAVPYRTPNFGASPQGRDTTFQIFNPEVIDDEGAMLGLAYTNVLVDGRMESGGQVVLRVARDGTPRIVASPPQYDDERWMVTVSGFQSLVPFTFRPRRRFARDGGRFLFATADQSTLDGTDDLTMLRSTGDTVFAQSYAYDGEPIPASVMDSAIFVMRSESGRRRSARTLARQRAPAVFPPTDVTLGLDGTVWAELHPTDHGTPVHVVGEAGDPIGFLRLPVRSKIQQASRTHVWVTETNLVDLASVVRYRVIRQN